MSADHLAALAEEMRLSQAEVYETATFYAHFDVMGEGDPTPPDVTVRVCDSITCAMMGAEKLIAALKNDAPGNVRVVRAPCMGGCDRAPVWGWYSGWVDQTGTECGPSAASCRLS